MVATMFAGCGSGNGGNGTEKADKKDGGKAVSYTHLMNNNAAAQGGGGKMMNFGKNRAKLTTQEENHIKFSDVAGLKLSLIHI